MTTETIIIAKGTRKETTKGYRINDYFAVTRWTFDPKLWTVTHRPSGLSATPRIMGGYTSTMLEACVWGLILSSYSTDWDSVEPALPNRQTLQVLANRYRKVLGN